MRLLALVILWLIDVWTIPAAAGGGPLDDPLPAATADPSLAASVRFPPSLATHGIARIGSASGSSRGAMACTGTNPCAVPAPALDRAALKAD